MRAIQVMGPGLTEIVEVPVPRPEAGQVLVRVEGCATCPQWDLTLWRGADIFERPGYPRYPLLPGRPGHEMAGTVAAVGGGVRGVAEGERVASIYDSGEGRSGFYAEYALAQEDQLLRLPGHLDVADTVSLELATCVAVSFQRAGNLTGLRVGISGLGPAGLIAVQMARALGAAEVVGFEIDPERATLARTLGADRVVDPRTEEFAALAALPAAEQLDLSVECAGAAASTENLLRVTRARVLLFGVPHGTFHFGIDAWAKGVQVEGYGGRNEESAPFALDLMAAGAVRLAPLLSARLPFSRYSEGVALLQRREAIKVLYVPDEVAR